MFLIDLFKRIRKRIPVVCEMLEMVIAVFVLVGMVCSLIGMFRQNQYFTGMLDGTVPFSAYIEAIFTLVIGIEFMEMLCRPNAANVLEVLIFLVARHMIIEHTTVYMDFVSVISICILCVVRRFLRYSKEKHDEEHHIVDDTQTLDN